uniref:C-type lectin domain-containing protein n=1 Tax=Caenorhabditis japonica TaxID=281687 RepID=A0A8R1HW82_CAEJA
MLLKPCILLLAWTIVVQSMGVPHYFGRDDDDCYCPNSNEDPDDEPTTKVSPTSTTTEQITTEETTTVAPTTVTTTNVPTTTVVTTTQPICPSGTVQVLRKRGYWCWRLYALVTNAYRSMPYDYAVSGCASGGGGMQLSSIETQEEWDIFRYASSIEKHPVTAAWLAIGHDNTTNQFYYNDGYVYNTTIDPQPLNVVPGGPVAFFWNWDSNVPGYGHYATTMEDGHGYVADGVNQTYVNIAYCGVPGRGYE